MLFNVKSCGTEKSYGKLVVRFLSTIPVNFAS